MFITSDMFYLEPFLTKCLLNMEIAQKKPRRHAEFISASHVQVSTGKVCNRQVGDLAGVNILWNADPSADGLHDVRFLTFETNLLCVHIF